MRARSGAVRSGAERSGRDATKGTLGPRWVGLWNGTGNERPVEAKAGSAWMPAAWYTCVDASEVTVHAGVAGGVGQSVTQSHSQSASRSRLRGAIAWAFCFFSSSLFTLFFFYFLIPIFCAVFQLGNKRT